MRYFTWTETAGPGRPGSHAARPGTGAPGPGGGAPRPGAARGARPGERVLDEICCLEMT
jgi:hypothetical protein